MEKVPLIRYSVVHEPGHAESEHYWVKEKEHDRNKSKKRKRHKAAKKQKDRITLKSKLTRQKMPKNIERLYKKKKKIQTSHLRSIDIKV